MAGPILLREKLPGELRDDQADYKGRQDLKSCLSEFHRIL